MPWLKASLSPPMHRLDTLGFSSPHLHSHISISTLEFSRIHSLPINPIALPWFNLPSTASWPHQPLLPSSLLCPQFIIPFCPHSFLSRPPMVNNFNYPLITSFTSFPLDLLIKPASQGPNKNSLTCFLQRCLKFPGEGKVHNGLLIYPDMGMNLRVATYSWVNSVWVNRFVGRRKSFKENKIPDTGLRM